MKQHSGGFLPALQASVPVFFGYISIGIAFGFLLVKAGFPWLLAPLMSLTVFAGAAQFLAVGMLSSGASPLEMGFAVLLVNARHLVYGFSLLRRFSGFHHAGGALKAYMVFALTDETYGLLTTIEAPEGSDPELFDFWISLLNHGYWVLGSLVGALAGSWISWDGRGIEFSMTALFVVLLIEQVRNLRRPGPFLWAAAGVALLYLSGLPEHALLGGILIGSAACFFLEEFRRFTRQPGSPS